MLIRAVSHCKSCIDCKKEMKEVYPEYKYTLEDCSCCCRDCELFLKGYTDKIGKFAVGENRSKWNGE